MKDTIDRINASCMLTHAITAWQHACAFGYGADGIMGPAIAKLIHQIGTVYLSNSELAWFDTVFDDCDMEGCGIRWTEPASALATVQIVEFTSDDRTKWKTHQAL